MVSVMVRHPMVASLLVLLICLVGFAIAKKWLQSREDKKDELKSSTPYVDSLFSSSDNRSFAEKVDEAFQSEDIDKLLDLRQKASDKLSEDETPEQILANARIIDLLEWELKKNNSLEKRIELYDQYSGISEELDDFLFEELDDAVELASLEKCSDIIEEAEFNSPPWRLAVRRAAELIHKESF